MLAWVKRQFPRASGMHTTSFPFLQSLEVCRELGKNLKRHASEPGHSPLLSTTGERRKALIRVKECSWEMCSPGQLTAELHGVEGGVPNVLVMVLHYGRCVEGHKSDASRLDGLQRPIVNAHRLHRLSQASVDGDESRCRIKYLFSGGENSPFKTFLYRS